MRRKPNVDFTGLIAPRRQLELDPYLERRETGSMPGVLARILYWLGVVPVETQQRYTGSVFAPPKR